MINKYTAGKFSQSNRVQNMAHSSSGHSYIEEIRALYKSRRLITVSQDSILSHFSAVNKLSPYLR